MITNKNTVDAHIIVNLYFEDKEPVKGLHLTIPAERVVCYRVSWDTTGESITRI